MDLKQLILEANDLAEEVYEVPEWNASILLRGLTCEQLQRARNGAMKAGQLDTGLLGVLVLIEGANDPASKDRLFEQAHRDALLKKNASVVDRIATRILTMSGAGPNAQADAEKN